MSQSAGQTSSPGSLNNGVGRTVLSGGVINGPLTIGTAEIELAGGGLAVGTSVNLSAQTQVQVNGTLVAKEDVPFTCSWF